MHTKKCHTDFRRSPVYIWTRVTIRPLPHTHSLWHERNTNYERTPRQNEVQDGDHMSTRNFCAYIKKPQSVVRCCALYCAQEGEMAEFH